MVVVVYISARLGVLLHYYAHHQSCAARTTANVVALGTRIFLANWDSYRPHISIAPGNAGRFIYNVAATRCTVVV